MDQQTQQTAYWDSTSVAHGYCKEQIAGLEQFAVAEMLEAALHRHVRSRPKRILEVGGGSQFLARRLAQRFPEAEIVCTDISGPRVEAFRNFYPTTPRNLSVFGGVDARSLPFEDGQFDLILGDAMLHHIDFLKPALFEFRRCLAPGGKAIFVREPVIGLLGIWLYRLFQLSPASSKKHIEINYFEYKRMLTQWQYEFIMAGFDVKLLRFWRNQGLAWKLRSILPHLTPCYLGFILEGSVNVTNMYARSRTGINPDEPPPS